MSDDDYGEGYEAGVSDEAESANRLRAELEAALARAERAERVAYYKRFKDAETEVARLRAVLAELPSWPGCASYRAQAEVERLRGNRPEVPCAGYHSGSYCLVSGRDAPPERKTTMTTNVFATELFQGGHWCVLEGGLPRDAAFSAAHEMVAQAARRGEHVRISVAEYTTDEGSSAVSRVEVAAP